MTRDSKRDDERESDPPIRVRGARTHNLKSIDVDVPSRALVVITGPSGAGKSSLALDTLYAEAQRRFVESLSTHARAAHERLPKPDVDSIEGLSPAIAIEPRPLGTTLRSTLGTVTEVSDHLRLLYARIGRVRCPICGERLRAESPQQITDELLRAPAGTKLTLLAPIVRGEEGDLAAPLERLRREGYVRARVDGVPIDLSEVSALDAKTFKQKKHDLDVVVDRLVTKASADAIRARLGDSIELSLRVGAGRMRVLREPPGAEPLLEWRTERFACEKDDFTFPPIEPRLFSFNSPAGACEQCEGLGERAIASEQRVVPDPSRSLRQGAIAAWGAPGSVAYAVECKRASDATGVDVDVAWGDLPSAARELILRGGEASNTRARGARSSKDGKTRAFEGVAAWLDRQLDGASDDAVAERLDDDGAVEDGALAAMREARVCPSCKGARLRREALSVDVGGLHLAALGALPLPRARAHLASVLEGDVDARTRTIATPLIEAIDARLRFLVEIGLPYLSIDRAANALSNGEGARIRLATQLAVGLNGVLYVLDEPSIGLHARDTERLLLALERLRAMGNTVVVVEHDLDLVRAADHVIDIGPVAGAGGGYVLAEGTPDELARAPRSVTGPWLRSERSLPSAARREGDPSRVIALRGATLHNLRSVDVDVPLGLLVCVTGVSGSGKSSLIAGTLLPAVRAAVAARGRALAAPAHATSIEGAGAIDKVVELDASPIGRSPRSTPASYVGVMAKLRELFAALPEARARGYKPGRFSSNVKGGRCEACRGEGLERIPMSFLPDVYVVCAQCNGARFNRETLEVRYRGRSIADVLANSVDDAHVVFEMVPQLRERLAALRSVGLGYLALGQPSTTLSGGEAQRIKLARELARKATGSTLYVLDEPTTGLHPVDVAVLLEALYALRDQGNSIVVVEHDLDFVARADWVIDLGPDAGEGGGEVVAVGTPESIASGDGITARHLARHVTEERATAATDA